MRLAEYAKSRDRTAADVSAAADRLGLSSTHHLATLTDEDVAALDAHFGAEPKAAASVPALDPTPETVPASPVAPLIDSIVSVLADRPLTHFSRIVGLLRTAGVVLPTDEASALRAVREASLRELTKGSASRLVHAAKRLVRVR